MTAIITTRKVKYLNNRDLLAEIHKSKNTYSSNIYVTGVVELPETIDLLTEDGNPLTAEDGRILILG